MSRRTLLVHGFRHRKRDCDQVGLNKRETKSFISLETILLCEGSTYLTHVKRMTSDGENLLSSCVGLDGMSHIRSWVSLFSLIQRLTGLLLVLVRLTQDNWIEIVSLDSLFFFSRYGKTPLLNPLTYEQYFRVVDRVDHVSSVVYLIRSYTLSLSYSLSEILLDYYIFSFSLWPVETFTVCRIGFRP